MKPQIVKFSISALCQFFLVAMLCAQNAPTATDAVYLVSGQTHQGIIVEQKPGVSIRLWRIAESDTLTFEMEAIDRIVKIVPTGTSVPSLLANIMPLSPPPSKVNTRPWATAIQLSTGGGDHSFSGLGVAVQRRLPNLRSWTGLGMTYIGDINNYGPSAIGLAAHGSHEFSTGWKERLGALVFADLGYSFNLGTDYFDGSSQMEARYGDGMHLQTGIRFRANVLPNVGIWVDLSYLRHTSMLRSVAGDDKIRRTAWDMFSLRGSVFF